jgi:hypothetical protein
VNGTRKDSAQQISKQEPDAAERGFGEGAGEQQHQHVREPARDVAMQELVT